MFLSHVRKSVNSGARNYPSLNFDLAEKTTLIVIATAVRKINAQLILWTWRINTPIQKLALAIFRLVFRILGMLSVRSISATKALIHQITSGFCAITPQSLMF
jgi:hypothetical protein